MDESVSKRKTVDANLSNSSSEEEYDSNNSNVESESDEAASSAEEENIDRPSQLKDEENIEESGEESEPDAEDSECGQSGDEERRQAEIQEKRLLAATEKRKKFGTTGTLSAIKELFRERFERDIASRGRTYLLSGGSLKELLDQLKLVDFRKKSHAVIIFEAIQITIIRCIREKLIDPLDLIESCKCFVTDHIVDVMSLLALSCPIPHRLVAMKLLAALAAVDDVIALQLLSSIEFTRDQLKMLAHHDDPTNPASLRVNFIHFLMSLIIGHSANVIRKLCNKKSWLPSIFAGMKFDLLSTVSLVLKTLDDNLIMNQHVPKTSKLFTFNSKALADLADLYQWNPASFVEITRNCRVVIEPPDADDVTSVRQLVHILLLHLLTSTKYGVVFSDPSYGTSQLNANETANQFLKESGQPWEDLLKQELFSSMLSTCPDLLKSFYNLIRQMMPIRNPNRMCVIWKFLNETISSIKLIPESFSTAGRALTVSNQLFLHAFLWETVAFSISEKAAQISLLGLQFYMAFLEKMKTISAILESRQKNASRSFLNKISAHLCKFPVTGTHLLEALSNFHSHQSWEEMKTICDVIISLNNLLPSVLDAVKFSSTHINNLKDVIEGAESAEGLLLLKLIKVQLLLDHQIMKKEEAFDLNKVCKTIVSSDDNIVTDFGFSIIKDYLLSTGFFSSDSWELDLWMKCIKNHMQSNFGEKLSTAVLYAEENKFTISNAILRTYSQQPTLPSEHLDLKLDDFLKMAERDFDDEEDDHNMFPDMRLSPLLPGFISANAKMGNVVKSFIVHYAHMIQLQGFTNLLRELLPKKHTILDYLDTLCRGELGELNFSPFSETVFEDVYHSSSTQSIDCLNKMKPGELDLVAALLIQIAVRSLDSKRLSWCAKMFEQIETISKTKEYSCQFKAENLFRCPGLLDGFHPVQTSSGHMNQIVHILCRMTTDANHLCVKPFTQRLYLELDCAVKSKLSFEKEVFDSSALECSLQYFPLTKGQVGHLISDSLLLPSKYFVNKRKSTSWVKVLETLLKSTSSMKLTLSEDELSKLLRILSKMVACNDDQKSNLPDLVCSYFRKNRIEICGQLHDSAIALLQSLCVADTWHEQLACFLINQVDTEQFSLPPDTCFERKVKLLAKGPRPIFASLDGDEKLIGKALSCNADYLIHLKDICQIALNEHMCSTLVGIVKNGDVYPSSPALEIAQFVFARADKLADILTLLNGWMETHLVQNPDLCVDIADSFDTVSVNFGSDVLPSLSRTVVDHLITDGLSRPCRSMITLLQRYLLANLLYLDPSTLFQKLTSHSQFDSVLTGSEESSKCALIELLSTLIEKDGSLIDGKRLPGFLAAYQATLSQSDQLLLKIIQLYEKNGVSLTTYKPLLWGDTALSHYSVNKKPTLSRSHPYQTLDALNPSLVINTIANFPIHRDVDGFVTGEQMVYDPAFLLPVLCQVALVDHKVKSRMFFQSGGIGIALASLASSSERIRRLAALFLQRVHKNHSGQDKIVWLNFIEAIRRGISELLEQQSAKKKSKSAKANNKSPTDVPRISSITATFLARASTVLGDPSAPLFRPLHYFIMARPALNLNGVPAFLELLHSTDVKNHERHREWIMEVIRDGMRQPCDLQLVLNSFTLKIILVFYSSSLATARVKRLIEQIVSRCLGEPDKENRLLLNKYSIIPWTMAANKPPTVIGSLPKLSATAQHGPLIALASER